MNGFEFLCALPWKPDAMTYFEDLGIVCVKAGERPLLVQIVDGKGVVSEVEITEGTLH